MVVGAVLPAGRPDQLVDLAQAQQLGPGAIGDAMGHPVDQMKAPTDLVEWPVEAEDADHAVDVNGQDRTV